MDTLEFAQELLRANMKNLEKEIMKKPHNELQEFHDKVSQLRMKWENEIEKERFRQILDIATPRLEELERLERQKELQEAEKWKLQSIEHHIKVEKDIRFLDNWTTVMMLKRGVITETKEWKRLESPIIEINTSKGKIKVDITKLISAQHWRILTQEPYMTMFFPIIVGGTAVKHGILKDEQLGYWRQGLDFKEEEKVEPQEFDVYLAIRRV